MISNKLFLQNEEYDDFRNFLEVFSINYDIISSSAIYSSLSPWVVVDVVFKNSYRNIFVFSDKNDILEKYNQYKKIKLFQ